ncbi:hypothetical protein LZ519_04850 [Sphingomonas sp. RG327]|uniref:Uncharacterized protein n=1 Tax=Sphingomonas anseongensis TaxID=2908207 RepID=A0ABT0REE9_9SPHN|nr:hypothetical protein [Sphingomonas anseongensis]MCL6678647.1 hypothetical protein [Sphingomonas anseongensis]
MEDSEPHPQEPGPFQDIPKWIWRLFFFGWGSIFLLFVLFFATDGGAAFAITVAVMFLFMAFGLPIAMAAQGHCDSYECKRVIQTRSGPLSQRAAATQIALIPIAAAMGLTIFILLAK